MSSQLFTQTKMYYILIFLLSVALVGITACGGQQAPQPAAEVIQEVEKEVVVEKAAAEAPAADSAPAEQQAPAEAGDSASDSSISPVSNRPNVYNRLIIKNAEVELLVADTDMVIHTSMNIVAEYGGYVVSNRTWFKDEFKYATLTIGVPSENFEAMLNRLKGLALIVTNETVSGQDVTDEYVDLKSRLTNLEATAARIRTFLEQAKTVEESLEVSQQLGEIEAEIEQVKGRMVYLKDRAAFSTITLQISPQIPTPTPMPSPTPTVTPTPTPTPIPWSPSQTFDDATTVTNNAARSLFRVAVDLVIWVVVVILPFTLPVVAVIWLTVWVLRRLGVVEASRPPSS